MWTRLRHYDPTFGLLSLTLNSCGTRLRVSLELSTPFSVRLMRFVKRVVMNVHDGLSRVHQFFKLVDDEK